MLLKNTTLIVFQQRFWYACISISTVFMSDDEWLFLASFAEIISSSIMVFFLCQDLSVGLRRRVYE
jgi:hypothetical protein